MILLFYAFTFSKLFVIVCRILSQMILLIFFSLFYISNLENKKFEIKKLSRTTIFWKSFKFQLF